MNNSDLLQTAIGELATAATQQESGSKYGNVKAALAYLSLIEDHSLTDEEMDNKHFCICISHAVLEEYEVAYNLLSEANDGRDISDKWKQLGALLILGKGPGEANSESIDQCALAIEWLKSCSTPEDNSIAMANLYGHKAFYHLRLGEIDDAWACCDIAFELRSDYLAPLRMMSEISFLRNRYLDAIRYLSLSIAKRTSGSLFWDFANRSHAYMEIGNYRDAYKDLQVANQLEPQNPAVLNNMGLLMGHIEEISDALRYFNEALLINWRYAPAHNNKGHLFYNINDFNQAEREFSIAISVEPDNSSLWFNRAICRYYNDKYGECLSDINESMNRGHIRNWQMQYMSGMCEARLQKYSTAITLLKTVVLRQEADPETLSMVWNNIGVICHRMDDKRTAHQCFSNALNLDPFNKQAVENIDIIEANMSGNEIRPTEEGMVEIGTEISRGSMSLQNDDFKDAIHLAGSIASLIGISMVLA